MHDDLDLSQKQTEQSIRFDYGSLHEKVPFWTALGTLFKNKTFVFAMITCFVILLIAIKFALDGVLVAYFIIGVLAIIFFGAIGNHRTAHQMRTFAARNGLVYADNGPGDRYQGLIFGKGHSRKLQGYEFADDSPLQIISNYTYSTGSGKSRRTHRYGFVRMELPRRLPHMVLDAKANNFFGFSNMPASFQRNQRISLEGDFDKYFTLYASREYETDALYVFTPDIMQLLIDDVANFDIEIIDQYLYFYSSGRFDLTSPERIESLLTLADKIAQKFERRVDYYADDRVLDRSKNIIAEPGRRLKNGIPVTAIIIFIIYLLFIMN